MCIKQSCVIYLNVQLNQEARRSVPITSTYSYSTTLGRLTLKIGLTGVTFFSNIIYSLYPKLIRRKHISSMMQAMSYRFQTHVLAIKKVQLKLTTHKYTKFPQIFCVCLDLCLFNGFINSIKGVTYVLINLTEVFSSVYLVTSQIELISY